MLSEKKKHTRNSQIKATKFECCFLTPKHCSLSPDTCYSSSYLFWFLYIWFVRLRKILKSSQNFFPCWEKEKKKIIFACPLFHFLFLEIVLLLLCQICVDVRSSIVFPSLTLMKTLTTLCYFFNTVSLPWFLLLTLYSFLFCFSFQFSFACYFFSLTYMELLRSSKSYFCFPFLCRFGQWWLWYCSLVEDFWFLGSLQWKNRWSSKFKM